MKPLTQRNKMLGGIFLIVGVAWSMDMLTGGPAPDAAGAASSPQLAQPAVIAPPEPPDLNALIDQVTHAPVMREPLFIDDLSRDLFSPTDAFVDNTASAEAEADAAAKAQAVAEMPRALQGIIEGHLPLALIDGRLLRQGAEINGYRLIEIEHDSVVLEREGERVTLRLDPVGGAPK